MPLPGIGTNDVIDLDTFLTQIESKLRAPFTSLEFAKAVTTAAATTAASTTSSSSSNGNKSAVQQYLSNVLAVLPRAEREIQLHILIGILGIEPSNHNNTINSTQLLDDGHHSLDDQLRQILVEAQQSPLYEEWVRIIAGIVEEMLFRDSNNNDDDDHNSHDKAKSTNNNEARRLIDKTCNEIIKRVRKLEEDTSTSRLMESSNSNDPIPDHFLLQSDSDPLYCPFRYHLLSPSTLQKVLPDTMQHSHFIVNHNSSILQIDDQMEIEKVKEEQEHQRIPTAATTTKVTTKTTTSTNTQQQQQQQQQQLNSTIAVAGAGTLSSKLEQRKLAIANAKAKSSSSSMFLPSKRPAAIGGFGTTTKAITTGNIIGRNNTSEQQLTKKPVGAAGGATIVGLQPIKTQLHQRKAGAAQALLAKGRRGRMMQQQHGGSTETATATTTTATSTGKPTMQRPMAMGRTSMMSTTTTTTANRGNPLSSSTTAPKVKMKMIDVTEVQGLEAKKLQLQQAATEEIVNNKTTKNAIKNHHNPSTSTAGKKRPAPITENKAITNDTSKEPPSKIRKTDTHPANKSTMDSTTSTTSTTTTTITNNNTATVARAGIAQQQPETTQPDLKNKKQQQQQGTGSDTAAGQLASAVLLAYQSQKASSAASSSTQSYNNKKPSQLPTTNTTAQQQLYNNSKTNTIASTPTTATATTKQQDWRELLQLRSNRLSDDDRLRIKHFFVDNYYNPTPALGNKYKIKLHEARTTDPITGKQMKETFYLDLDYDTNTSTQSKKVKRYDAT